MSGIIDPAEEIRRFADTLFEPDDIVEIRALHSGNKPAQQQWSAACELGDLTSWCMDRSREGYSLHVSANPRTSIGGSKTEDVDTFRCLFVDFDDVPENEVKERIDNAKLPMPTVLIESGRPGGGFHCYWGLDDPIDDPEIWTALQKAIISKLGSDPAPHDPARIMRLPGFVHPKYDAKPVAHIVYCDPERTYTRDRFPDVEPAIPGYPEPIATNGNGRTASGDRVAAYVETWESVSEGGRSSAAVRHAAQLTHDFGLSVSEALPYMRTWNTGNTPPLEDDELCKIVKNGDRYGKHARGTMEDRPQCDRPQYGREPKPSRPRADPWVPFPVDVFPEPLQTFIHKASAAVGVDTSYIALPMLSTLAAAIGTTFQIKCKESWPEPCVLWAIIVGDSGTVKTPCVKIATEPLRRAERESFKWHKEQMEKYEADRESFEAEAKMWKKRHADGKDDPDAPQPVAPVRPVHRRHVTSDITIEALVMILDANPRGLLGYNDEFARFLRSFDSYRGGKGGDMDHYLQMHGAGAVTMDRKSTEQKLLHIPRAAVSLTGSIQPGVLADLFGRKEFDSGMVARFLMAHPPKRRKRWTDDDLTEDDRQPYRDVVNGLLNLKHSKTDGDLHPKTLWLTDEAKAAWVKFFHEGADRQFDERDSRMMAALSKHEGLAERLAMVFHLCRVVAEDPSIEDRYRVDLQSMLAGIKLALWISHESRRIYVGLAGAEHDAANDRTEAYIQGKGGTIAVREFTRWKHCTADHARREIQPLVDAHRGEWVTFTDRPGRRPEPSEFRLFGQDS